MLTTHTDGRPDTCQHAEIRVGCLACCAEDAQADLREASSQKLKCLETIKGYEAYLSQNSELPKDQKLLFDQRLVKERELGTAWDERVTLLQDISQTFAEAVRTLCASNNHDNGSAALAEQFEADATERAFSLELIWRASASHEPALVKFAPEDLGSKTSFTGVDRSSIQATPDWIIDNGLGFSVFLKSTNATRRPSQGLGPQPGPATMSYGRAISEFGLPDPPEAGPQGAATSNEQLSTEDEIATQFSACHLDSQKAVTESELRLARGDLASTAPKFKEDILWSMFGAGKFMTFAGVIVRQYAKLVAQRIAEENRKKQEQEQKGETQEESSAVVAAGASTGPATDSETGLPVVQGHDYYGLTNWLCRCLINHKDFLHVTQRWDKERNTRNQRVAARIKEWSPPMNFEDGRLGQPDPKNFYNGKPLGAVDQAKMGIKTKLTKH
ncbi:hypothetical protein C7974DRAFT_168559 [Boeremia exigua]|uniref:uncharacterized protein n=1 Tax=Boeremia exigua TaxID=749465 RepID=UPI001E8DF5E6|nr:uncharacterized protein C7974DRAFT_168559 [Boeremia exigua]KAH6633270.1 hypothetical protein C7974DRAFT_168559 [Boeremia exigua]